MKRETGRKAATISVAEYPGLREFFSAYLHEDFRDEYGSAAGAARAFCEDASHPQARQARQEWARMRKSFTGRAIPEWQEALRKLGGSWQPQTEEELQSLDVVFSAKA
jgi:hypothetical protein